MSRSLCFTLFFCLSAIVSNAQSNYIEGYYVTSKQDTVHGFINARSTSANFYNFLFRSEPTSESHAISTKDAESFTIAHSMVFEKHTFKEKDVTDLTGFFKVEVRGKLTLLTNGKRYFALTDKNDLLEVSSHREVSGTTTNNRKGFGTLKALMKDCPTTNDAYLTKEYSDKNLKKIFIAYNECVGNQVFVGSDVKATTKFNAGLQILPSIATMNSGYPMAVSDMSWSKNLGGGIFVSAVLPAYEKIQVMLEANYYQYSGYGYAALHDTNNTPVNSDVFVKYQALQIPLFIRVGNKYFFDFGIQNHLVLGSNIRWRLEGVTSNAVLTIYSNSNEAPKFWTTGLVIGGGMKFDVASFPVRVFARYSRNGNPFFSGNPGYQMAAIGVSLQLTPPSFASIHKNQK